MITFNTHKIPHITSKPVIRASEKPIHVTTGEIEEVVHRPDAPDVYDTVDAWTPSNQQQNIADDVTPELNIVEKNRTPLENPDIRHIIIDSIINHRIGKNPFGLS